MYGGEATLTRIAPTVGSLNDEKIWEGPVYVFDLLSRYKKPKYRTIYGWFWTNDWRQQDAIYTALHSPSMATPQAAVDAGIRSRFAKDIGTESQ
jgi:hypothetical protein